jgi:hypothetical protein
MWADASCCILLSLPVQWMKERDLWWNALMFPQQFATCKETCEWSGCAILEKLFCIQGICKMLGQNSGVSFQHQNKGKSWYQYMSANKGKSWYQYMSANAWFSRNNPRTCWTQSFRFLFVGMLKPTTVFSYSWKWRGSSPMYFWCLSNHLQLPRDLSKGAAVHDQTCPCIHCFKWRTFWTFVVNCDLCQV